MDDLLREFLVETGENLVTVDTQLVTLEHEPNNQDILRALFRLVHTIKGTCGFFGLPRLEALAHAAETVMGQFRDGAPVTRAAVSLILSSIDRIKFILAAIESTGAEPPGDDAVLIAALDSMARGDSAAALTGDTPAAAAQAGRAAPDSSVDMSTPPDAAAALDQTTLRVNIDTLERLMTMVSELVLTRNQLLEVARQAADGALGAPLQRLNHVTGELQDCVMKTRLQPLAHACQKLPRLVRDLSVDLGKDIALAITGAETELDRQVLDLIKDPLTHLVRNAADHGIEAPAVRLAAGKPERGTIHIAARHTGGALVIDIRDDGRGLDLARIRAKALERRLASEPELARMSDARLARLIFHPGFSTADTVSAISGRGVGMDVVAANVERAGGRVDVQSRAGQGAHVTITLPLTLAIVPALLVGIDGQRLALPQSAIAELVRIGPGSDAVVERLDKGAMLRLRGAVYPVVSLGGVLGLHERQDAGYGALLSVNGRQFAVLVDAVLQTEEIVVKPIAATLRDLALYSGCTILGDGAVVLILEPNALARIVLGELADAGPVMDDETPNAAGDAPAALLLVVRSGGQRQALPLAAITRLERLRLERLEWSGPQALMQYDGRLMPVSRLDGAAPAAMQGEAICIVLHHQDRAFGLLCDEIIDVIESDIDLSFATPGEGMLGAAIVQGAATDIVDVVHHLARLYPDAAPIRSSAGAPVLLVEGSAFFRDMFAPVLRAAGYGVTVMADHAAAAALAGQHPVLVIDCDCDAGDAALGELCRAAGAAALIGLSSSLDAQRREAFAALGIGTLVSKFDRRGLITLLRAALPPAAVREAA